MNLNQITLPALDVAASVAFYRRMGFTQIAGSAHYARFEYPAGEGTFSVHQADAAPSDSGIVAYFECDDRDERVTALQRDGFVFSKRPTDERWLWREARLVDPAGNVLCLYRAGSNRRFPRWRPDGNGAEISR